MSEASRYRIENGTPCIDIQLSSLEQIFDKRDPAPFRDRDLDPVLSEYLLDTGEDLLGKDRVSIVFWVEQPEPPRVIEEAVHAHFDYVIERSRRERRRQVRTGHVILLVAILLVIALLSLSQVIEGWIPGSVGAAFKEGLVISCWVLLWRPAEILLYDWIPVRHIRRVATMLRAAPVDVRVTSSREARASAAPASP